MPGGAWSPSTPVRSGWSSASSARTQKVSPRVTRRRDEIGYLAERMERYGWHSVSINPVPLGYQYIIQAKSEKRREDEARQQAAQDAAQPQPTATFAAARPPVVPPAAAAAPAAASQGHTRSTNRLSNPGPTSRPRCGRGSGRAASRTGSP